MSQPTWFFHWRLIGPLEALAVEGRWTNRGKTRRAPEIPPPSQLLEKSCAYGAYMCTSACHTSIMEAFATTPPLRLQLHVPPNKTQQQNQTTPTKRKRTSEQRQRATNKNRVAHTKASCASTTWGNQKHTTANDSTHIQ